MTPRVSLTARLALLFAALTAILLVVVALVLGRAVEAHFLDLDRHELSGKLSLIRNLLQHADPATGWDALPQRLDDAFIGHDTMGVLMRAADGSIVYGFQPDHFGASQLAGEQLPAGDSMWQQRGRQYIGREAVVSLPGAAGEPARLQVVVALDISHHAHFLDQVRNRLWIGVAVAAIVAALFGWFAAHRGLAPLRRVTVTARYLSAERLGERLAQGEAPAEVQDLVEAFNGMLDRLEASFQRLSDFSADIAHELRTPISNLMTQAQVALSRARSADEYRELLASALEEYERIARMVSDMLFLAQAENGRLPRPVERVALAEEARALIEFYEALAEEKGVRIVLDGDAVVTGDRLMLRRALSNLLSNALRHTASGGVVRIAISCDEGQEGRARLELSNPGETIPPDHLSQIFERFHRASPERHRHGEGAGLGLAITRSIVETHGGRVAVASANGITCFSIELPRAT